MPDASIAALTSAAPQAGPVRGAKSTEGEPARGEDAFGAAYDALVAKDEPSGRPASAEDKAATPPDAAPADVKVPGVAEAEEAIAAGQADAVPSDPADVAMTKARSDRSDHPGKRDEGAIVPGGRDARPPAAESKGGEMPPRHDAPPKAEPVAPQIFGHRTLGADAPTMPHGRRTDAPDMQVASTRMASTRIPDAALASSATVGAKPSDATASLPKPVEAQQAVARSEAATTLPERARPLRSELAPGDQAKASGWTAGQPSIQTAQNVGSESKVQAPDQPRIDVKAEARPDVEVRTRPAEATTPTTPTAAPAVGVAQAQILARPKLSATTPGGAAAEQVAEALPIEGSSRGSETGDGVFGVAESAPSERSAAPAAVTVMRPDAAKPGAPHQQIAEAIRRANDNAVELRLWPEELGHVKMSMTGGEGVLTLQITVERPETLELIRRHLDSLAAELRSEGFANLDLSLGQGSGRDEGEKPGGRSAGAAGGETPTASELAAATTAARNSALPPGRLDLVL